MKFTRLMLTVAALSALPAFAAKVSAAPDTKPLHSQGRVFLLRGTGVVFSPGFSQMRDDLRLAGFQVEDLPSCAYPWVCHELIADKHAGRLSGPIIMVGHSGGGRHALRAAHELQAAGIEIDLIVTLDAGVASDVDVPANVKQVVNLYLEHSWYPSRALHAAHDAAPAIINLDLNSPNSPFNVPGVSHINIASSRAVRYLILTEIAQARDVSPLRESANYSPLVSAVSMAH